MVRFIVIVCVLPPPVPVTVTGYLLGVVPGGALKVIVELPDPGAGIDEGTGSKVTPLGKPVWLSATGPLKAPETVVVIVVTIADESALPETSWVAWVKLKSPTALPAG